MTAPGGLRATAARRRLAGERRRLQRGAYLLPSLFTIGNMLLGFYAVVWGLRGEFPRAALLVFTAGLLDGLDGRIARMTGTESEFGKEYDSLADVVTFGVVPALLAYLWAFGLPHQPLPIGHVEDPWARVGWLAPFFFLVCTATRLARFNVQTKIVDARYFVGLPTPAAAGAICSILFFAPDRAWKPWLEALVLAALLLIGALMVSTFRYRSFKQIDLRKPWSYRVALPLAAIVLVVAIHPPATFLVIAVLYTVSGPLVYLAGRLKRGHHSEPPHREEEATPPAPAAAEPRER